jgi:predicted nucleotidyltransferase
VERTIRALRDAKRLDGIDAAVIAAARSTARALDQAASLSPYVAATVARVHLEAVRQLTANAPAATDELGSVLRLMRTEVRDAADG